MHVKLRLHVRDTLTHAEQLWHVRAQRGRAAEKAERSHLLVHVVAALLEPPLDLLLQEVDPQLQAEVLLLQVVQVLRDGATADSRVRHADGWRWWGACTTPPITAASRLKAG